ncbi:hypothetical protein RASY3_01480 [Ruminococcus albus SY3]|uniref:Uncharacterized protein n=1 Tax=Ruminococcus albus SY3 TaxID=1341156 RepID=A0A011W036_RUMAL|nr:hypothetical protein [Ruminococcus albus]EXM40941.1 hypothetical protein RASY3_01480 [Ruminococcus albus SY3]
MNISNHEYHIRMLGNLAAQRKGGFISAYDTTENQEDNHCQGIISIVGKPSSILDLLANLVIKVADKLDIPVEILLLMLLKREEARKEDNDDDEQED